MPTKQTEIIIDEMPVFLQLPPIKVGQDYSFTIEFQDDNEDPISTTGWTMSITGRSESVNGEELFTLSVGSGITHTPSLGRFVPKIPSATTSTFAVTKIYWDCKVTDNNGEVNYPVEGLFEISGSSTR